MVFKYISFNLGQLYVQVSALEGNIKGMYFEHIFRRKSDENMCLMTFFLIDDVMYLMT